MKLYCYKDHPRTEFVKSLLEEAVISYEEENDLRNCNAYGIREVPALVEGDMILYFPQILSLCGGLIRYGNADTEEPVQVSENS